MIERTFRGAGFTTESVLSIIAGTKKQSRRLVKLNDHGRPVFYRIDDSGRAVFGDSIPDDPVPLVVRCPYGAAGGQLYVKETWRTEISDGRCGVRYAAGEAFVKLGPVPNEAWLELHGRLESSGRSLTAWRSVRHTPRWASRITLHGLSIRVERLQDITEADAKAEGVEPLGPSIGADQPIIDTPRRGRTHGTHPYTLAFAVAWDTINGDRVLWSSNPWVWVLTWVRAEVRS